MLLCSGSPFGFFEASCRNIMVRPFCHFRIFYGVEDNSKFKGQITAKFSRFIFVGPGNPDSGIINKLCSS
jgi:hypothetical protein